jgi:hypothetical protein
LAPFDEQHPRALRNESLVKNYRVESSRCSLKWRHRQSDLSSGDKGCATVKGKFSEAMAMVALMIKMD